MRSRTWSAAAVVASLTLLAGLTGTAADASVHKELKACWKAPTDNTLPLTVTVRGKQFGQRALANGTCKAWDVPTGNYTLTADAAAIRTTFNASPQGRAKVCGKSSFHDFRVYAVLTRAGTTRTVMLGGDGGTFGVHVRKGQLSKANFRLQCSS